MAAVAGQAAAGAGQARQGAAGTTAVQRHGAEGKVRGPCGAGGEGTRVYVRLSASGVWLPASPPR